ncbi:MAG: hypothetical protein J1F29_03440 [Lentimicrobiaceae bacterium]|nr:hypothetical protein [Lentimicrobiaceae bacterium]
MKTLIKLLLAGSLFFAGLGFASAQSAASSTREVVATTTDTSTSIVETMDTFLPEQLQERGIPTPPHIEKLFAEGNVTQALNEFEKFKEKQKKANPYDLLHCEMTVYQQALIIDPSNNAYAQKVTALRQELIERYPNVSDTYILQIDDNKTPEEIVELANKALDLDPENVHAYEQRGRALFKLNQIKEACADFEKMPMSWKNVMPEYWECRKL